MNICCINCGGSSWVEMCSGTALDYTNQRVYRVKYCIECGLAKTFPFPEKEEIGISYGRGAYSPAKKLFASGLEMLTQIFERIKLRRVSRLTQGGSLLDVGSGKGRFVRVANDQHWNAYGYEPYQEASTSPKYRNLFFSGDLDNLPLKDDSVDVVTMWHVLEHTADPLGTIQSVRRYLKEDGVLVIAVPNIESILAKLAKGLWYHLDVPRHLWHFSPKTLASLISSLGFEVISINYFSNQNVMSLWMSIGNMIKSAYNYPWNIIRLNQNMLRTVSIWRLIYSTVVHTLLFVSLPIMYITNVILCTLKLSDTFEIYARKIPAEI